MFSDKKTNLTLKKDLEAKNHKKYINIIYYHIYRLIEDGKLKIK